jgi:Holliday junction resolvasome RuvABC endonuclease subunit
MERERVGRRSIAGIDYSLTSPAVCVYTGDVEDFSYELCNVFFLSNTKRYSDFCKKNIDGRGNLTEWETPEERYDFISDWALDIILSNDVREVAIEDYSYGSTGKVFHIAEYCGLLKWKLWQAEIPYTLLSPSAIKKFATGKGNANKEGMYSSFCEESEYNLQEELLIKTTKVGNPTSDIVDAYYICKMALKNNA